jgi:hypothetical protein
VVEWVFTGVFAKNGVQNVVFLCGERDMFVVKTWWQSTGFLRGGFFADFEVYFQRRKAVRA